MWDEQPSAWLLRKENNFLRVLYEIKKALGT